MGVEQLFEPFQQEVTERYGHADADATGDSAPSFERRLGLANGVDD